MRTLTLILVVVSTIAVTGGTSLAGKGGNGGGGGKPGGGGGDPPPAADPVIAWFQSGDLMVMNADGSNPTLVLADAGPSGTSECVWSPDGTTIAFKGDVQGPGIYLIGVDGAGLAKIFDDPLGHPAFRLKWSPAAAPDGMQKIAFNLTVAGRTGAEVWLVNPDGSGLQNLTDNDMRTERYPTWSPDASRIAVEFLEFVEVNGTLVRTAAGLEVYDLAASGSGGVTIDWTSQETRKVFEEVADPAAYARWFRDLDWARTDDRLVYSRSDGTDLNRDLWILDLADATNPVQLTWSPLLEEVEPCWSPDDAHIVFRLRGIKKDAKKSGLWTIASDGSGATKLTSGGSQPDWAR